MTSNPIVITGPAGFIGRHLVARLAADGWPLRLAPRRMKDLPAAWRNAQAIEVFETGDLAECPPEGLATLADGASAIVHLAGQAGSRGMTYESYRRANVESTQRLCEAARHCGKIPFIFLSSIFAVTGHATDQSINDETDPAPVSYYGRTKLAAEDQVAKLAGKERFCISLRPPLVIGSDAHGNWKQLMTLAASGLPLPFAAVNNRRSFCHIDTLTGAISHLLSQAWPSKTSGSYAIADPGAASLTQTLRALRSGMKRADRLYRVPAACFRHLRKLPGLDSRVAALTGNQVVDASRFYHTFDFFPGKDVTQSIHECGAAYAQKLGMEEQ